jgi:hypothetical protein
MKSPKSCSQNHPTTAIQPSQRCASKRTAKLRRFSASLGRGPVPNSKPPPLFFAPGRLRELEFSKHVVCICHTWTCKYVYIYTCIYIYTHVDRFFIFYILSTIMAVGQKPGNLMNPNSWDIHIKRQMVPRATIQTCTFERSHRHF